MKFKDIPKFTQSGNWQTDMEWEYFIKWIQKLIEEDDLQLNPDFQRGHVWSESQQIAYIEFRLRGGKTGNVVYFNHPEWMGSFIGEFVCVDGLQRITAIQRFLNNEIKAFGTYYKDFEDALPRDIHMTVNINNLKTKEEVLKWYIEMNEGGTPHSEEEINKVKTMLKGMNYYENK